MIEGILIPDMQSDRADVCFNSDDFYGSLHCGTTMDIWLDGQWVPTRIEMGKRGWYLDGVQIETLWGRKCVSLGDQTAASSKLQSRHLCGSHSGILEPWLLLIVRQQKRHSVMDVDDGVIGSGGQNDKPFLPLKDVPEPGQIEPVFPQQPESVFCLSAIPFVESGCGNNTSLLQQRPANIGLSNSPLALMMTPFNTLDVGEVAMELFRWDHIGREPVRSLTVKASGLTQADEVVQLSLFSAEQKAQRRTDIDRTLDKIRSKYGYSNIRRAIMLMEPALDMDAKGEHIIHPIGLLGTLNGQLIWFHSFDSAEICIANID